MRQSCLSSGAVAFTLSLAALSPASAALSPYWQRVAEMQASAADQGVADALEARGPLEAIEAVGVDAYRVRAGRCTLDVNIVDAPAKGEPVPGPRRFTVKAGKLSCP